MTSALVCALMLAAGCGGASVGVVDAQTGALSGNSADSGSGGDSSSGGSGNIASEGAGGEAATNQPSAVGSAQAPISDVPTVSTEDSQQLLDQSDVQRPQPPRDLSVTRYSVSSGELFWKAAADNPASMNYVVYQDGVRLATVDTRSFYTDTLQPNTPHLFVVRAQNELGIESESASVLINADIDIPPPVYEFEMGLDRSRGAVDEGNTDGSRFVIDVSPGGNEKIFLQVQPRTPADADNVVVGLGKSELHRDDTTTSVTFKFPIQMQPIRAQERHFKVIATSGDQRRELEIILDIKPVQAPDVYLLIGQSNMVGSSELGAKDVQPGGLDERDERIWQLNVSPNNRKLFSGQADFLNESNNAISPRFILAEDPLHDPRNPIVQYKGGTSIGPGMSFAKAALSETTQRIYLVPAAWGATGFCKGASEQLAWNAAKSTNISLGGTGLLERALVRLRMTLRDTGGILRGVLWHQGGADANEQACADSYAGNLKQMVERIRREAAVDRRGPEARGSQAPIPFIVATQSRGRDDRGDFSKWSWTKQKVDNVHRTISSLVPYADWVNGDDLVPPSYPCGSTSCVHYGAMANREIGVRYYEALKQVWSR